MRQKDAFLLLCALGIASCNETTGTAELKNAEIIEAQIGRWQLVAGEGNRPSMIIDTATGCVELIEFIPDGPEAGKAIKSGLAADQPECRVLATVDSSSTALKAKMK